VHVPPNGGFRSLAVALPAIPAFRRQRERPSAACGRNQNEGNDETDEKHENAFLDPGRSLISFVCFVVLEDMRTGHSTRSKRHLTINVLLAAQQASPQRLAELAAKNLRGTRRNKLLVVRKAIEANLPGGTRQPDLLRDGFLLAQLREQRVRSLVDGFSADVPVADAAFGIEHINRGPATPAAETSTTEHAEYLPDESTTPLRPLRGRIHAAHFPAVSLRSTAG
jgi:hypothetical protein